MAYSEKFSYFATWLKDYGTISLCVTRQDFHWKLLSLYMDNRLAENFFAGGRTVTQEIGPKEISDIFLMYQVHSNKD